MGSKVHILGKCILIFLLSIIVWHIYRFMVVFSPYGSYLEWGTPQGYLFYLAFYISMFAVLVFFIYHIDHSSLRDMGLSKVGRWKTHIIVGVSFAFLARFLEIGLGVLVGGHVVIGSYSSLFVIVLFVVDTFFVGLSEEGVFRGYIQRKLTDLWEFLPALVFTSILFQIYHINFFTASLSNLVSTAVAVPSFGIFAGYFYYKSRGSLLGPTTLHMFYDLFGTIVPVSADITGIHLVLILASRILMWSSLIVVLKLLADKTRIFHTQ